MKSLLVITRGTDHARQLEAVYAGVATTARKRSVWKQPLTRDFLKVIYFLTINDQYAAVGAYESLIGKIAGHSSLADTRSAMRRTWGIAENVDTPYRAILFADLNVLKKSLLTRPCAKISDCVTMCGVDLRGIPRSKLAGFKDDCASFQTTDKKDQDHLMSSIFGAREARNWTKHQAYADVKISFATAHAAKGETHDAVLMVTKSRTSPCGCPQSAATWPKILKHTMSKCETKRIVYVALSRAAQHLMILTPAGADSGWRDLVLETDTLRL